MLFACLPVVSCSDVDASGSQSVTVSSPEVNMMITSRNGDEVATAQVGDPLSLRFEIADKSSEFYLEMNK